MKVYFSYQSTKDKYFLELDVSSSITVSELMEFVEVKTIVTNIDHDYKVINKPIAQQELIVNETEIGENCFIGSGVKIQAGTKLGFQCVVGANAVVRGEFPDYSVIVGVPAKVIKRLNIK